MAQSKEAIMILLDVGQQMSLPANQDGQSYLDLAKEAIGWIVNRKIFTESKDEIGLLLFGHNKTKNKLYKPGTDGQYEGVFMAHSLQTPDFKLVEYLQNEIKTTDTDGDFLDAIVVGVDEIVDATEGRKFGAFTLVLFSNMGGEFNDSQADTIAEALKGKDIELKVIGPDIRREDDEEADEDGSGGMKKEPKDDGLDDDQARGGSRKGANSSNNNNNNGLHKKSEQMERGEAMIRRILDNNGVDGECFTLTEALPMLCNFSMKSVKPMPWKAQMQIGNEISIPITMYVKTKEAKLKQTWKKVLDEGGAGSGAAAGGDTKVGMERTYQKKQAASAAGGDADDAGDVENKTNNNNMIVNMEELQVDKENLIKGYRFGTTLVPFTEDDLDALQYKKPGKVFQVLGFARKDQIPRHYFMGDSIHYCFGDKADQAGCQALSALIRALEEEGNIVIVRYAYNVRSAPRLGVLFPAECPPGEERSDMLVYVPIPYAEDIRKYAFPEFTEKSKPTDKDLDMMDDLITDMDLSQAKVNEEGEREEALDPEDIVNPANQYVFQCLRQRALAPNDPLAKPDPRFMQWMSGPSSGEIQNLVKPTLEKIAGHFPLKKVEPKKKLRMFGEDGEKADKDSEQPQASTSTTDDSKNSTNNQDHDDEYSVGSLYPVRDFERWILNQPDDFGLAARELASVIRAMVLETVGNTYYAKAISCLKSWRDAGVQFFKPGGYNEFLLEFKQLTMVKRPDFWSLIVKSEIQLIPKREVSGGVTEAEANEFHSEKKDESLLKASVSTEEDEELMDELE